MREIRSFEIEYSEPAVCWQFTMSAVLTVTTGMLWLTIEGDSRDYWLSVGESMMLLRGKRAWLSAGTADGAALALTREVVGISVPVTNKLARLFATG